MTTSQGDSCCFHRQTVFVGQKCEWTGDYLTGGSLINKTPDFTLVFRLDCVWNVRIFEGILYQCKFGCV